MRLSEMEPGRLYVVDPKSPCFDATEVMRYDPSPTSPTLTCDETGETAVGFARQAGIGYRLYCRESEILRAATPEEAREAGWSMDG